MFKHLPLATLTALAFTSTALAGQIVAVETTPEVKEKSLFDKIWAIPVLYQNKENPYLQELRFTGRFQVDAFTQDSNYGHADDWIIRRTRFGVAAKFFHDFTLAVEAGFDPQNPDPLYTQLTDAYLAWGPCEAFQLSVGKLSARFTMDGATSSTKLLTLERNNLSNNLWFTNEYFSGVNIAGKAGQWSWNTGLYSRDLNNPEFGEFDAGAFWLATVGYNFNKALGIDQAVLRADYVYNDPNPNSNGTRPFENIGSLTFDMKAGKFGLGTNVAAGQGYGTQPDVWGFVIMPSYDITDKLQVVARYTYMSSADPNGIRLNRYENVATSARGDEYNEFYFGVNYYFYGHKLKIQTGVDYADMKSSSGSNGGYRGWTWTTGFRMYF